MSSASARYRELVADLVAASRRHTAATATAQESYADGAAAVEHDLAAAEDAVSSASATVTQAHRVVAQTDLAAAGVWDELKRVRGRRGRRLGGVPDAACSSQADPEALLASASTRVERARRGGEPLPPMVLPLLFFLGAGCAALVALLGVFIGWLVLLPAPLAGLPLARHWVDHRFAARLDPGAIGVLVIGGMLASAGVFLTLR
ncbi:hypothetical protein [Catelliglobosispora koreensis]|uniref:hypothetical protein n=1 Tax=Catelliglobosispora koreensis TaxID=129052 RepID=UPI0003654DBE|nr:hypothetical protein [Catelliglobosispora koreensis]